MIFDKIQNIDRVIIVVPVGEVSDIVILTGFIYMHIL